MEKKDNINKIMIITFIMLLLTGLVTLFIILNKGNIFGKRLVLMSSEVVEKEIIHSIQITTDKKYLIINSDEQAKLIITVDGVDVQEGIEFQISDENMVEIENNMVFPLEKEGIVIIKAKSIEYDIEAEVAIEIVKSMSDIEN